MRRRVFIEGVLLLAIGLVGMAEGLRLTFYKDPSVLYDLLGPGLYVFVVSLGLMATGIVYLSINYGKVLSVEKVVGDREMRIRLISTILVYVAYTFLINIVGYLVATLTFFILEFRIAGVKSWKTNAVLTVIVSAINYIVFVQYCNVAFPRGIFFG